MKSRMLPLMGTVANLPIYRPGNVLSISSPKANGHRDSRGSEDAGALRKMLKRAGSMQSLLSLGSRRSQRYSVTSVRREPIDFSYTSGWCRLLPFEIVHVLSLLVLTHVVAMVDEVVHINRNQ